MQSKEEETITETDMNDTKMDKIDHKNKNQIKPVKREWQSDLHSKTKGG